MPLLAFEEIGEFASTGGDQPDLPGILDEPDENESIDDIDPGQLMLPFNGN